MLINSHPPLAERMRPARLDELVGQEHLTGPNWRHQKGDSKRKHSFNDIMGTTGRRQDYDSQYNSK